MNKPTDFSPEQLTFDVTRHTHAQLNAFICHPNNEALLRQLNNVFSGEIQAVNSTAFCWFLHGQKVGKTHLLNAICHAAQTQQLNSIYLPLKDVIDQSPMHVLENMEQFDVVCIDDIDSASISHEWQQSLFHLYNRLKSNGSQLFVTGSDVPDALNLSLDDLVSRFKWGLVYRLHPLGEAGLKRLLMTHLTRAGIRLQGDVIDYIMLRIQRDLCSILSAIRQLDQASLEQQRTITKPFVKQLFKW
ncbi:MAG: DnaA regulatory inactivator Hda [Pseudomonadota bacterium]